MERDKLVEISKGGRLQFDSSDLESESGRIDQIEEELKRSVFKEKKVSKTAAVGKVLLKNYAELKQGWDKETLYKATKKLKDNWDETILNAQERGLSSEDMFKLVHDEETALPFIQDFESNTQGLKASDRKEALENFKQYQKIAQRKVRAQAARDQLKMKRAKAERGLEDLRIAVIEGREGDKTIQSRFTDLLKSLDLGDSDRELYIKAARDAISRGKLEKNIYGLNEEEARKRLEIEKGKLSAREYSAYKKSIDLIPDKIYAAGDKVLESQSMEERALFSLRFKKSLHGEIFNLEHSKILGGANKDGTIHVPTTQEYLELAKKLAKGDPKKYEQYKETALHAQQKWAKYVKDNKREVISKLYDKEAWDKLNEEYKYKISGQNFDSLEERREVGQSALLAYKSGSFHTYRNELLKANNGDQNVVDRKLKEALLQLRRDNPKANKDAGGSFIDMLEVEIYAPGAIKFNKNSITRELEKNMKTPKYADINEAYEFDSELSELGNKLENMIGSLPGGGAIMRTIALQARAFARTAPLDEDSSIPPEEQRKTIFGEKLKELYKEALDNKKLVGDRGRWSKLGGAGINGRDFYFDNAAIGDDPEKRAKALEFSRFVKTKDVLFTGILHNSMLDKSFVNTFIQRNPKTNEIELWGTVRTEDGELQQIALIDTEGAPIRTTDADVARAGAYVFKVENVFRKSFTREYDPKLAWTLEDIKENLVGGSTDPKKHQDADLAAVLKARNSGISRPGGIVPKGFMIKGVDISRRPIEEQIKAIKTVEKEIERIFKGRGFGIADKLSKLTGHDKTDPRAIKIVALMAMEQDSLIRTRDGEYDEDAIIETIGMLRGIYNPKTFGKPGGTPIGPEITPVQERALTHLFTFYVVEPADLAPNMHEFSRWSKADRQKYINTVSNAFQKGRTYMMARLAEKGYSYNRSAWMSQEMVDFRTEEFQAYKKRVEAQRGE